MTHSRDSSPQTSRLAHYLSGLRDGTHATFARVANGVPLLSAKNVQIRGLSIGEESQISVSDAKAITAHGYPTRGDVLLTIVGSVGRSAVYDLDEALPFQRSVAFLRVDGRMEPRFLKYQLDSTFVQDQMALGTKTSAQPGLYLGAIAALQVFVRPFREQRAVADYLDRETARIDTLIEEQCRLIALLHERRAAVIDWAVWRGLSDLAPVSPTDIDPGCEAPTHWLRLRNKNLLYESSSVSIDGSEELLTVSHLTGITHRSEKNVNMIEAESLAGYRQVQPGDLVINTMWAWMGALGVSRVHGVASPAYGVYRPLRQVKIHSAYYDYLYRSRPYVVAMTRHSRGIWESRLRIYPEVFLRLPVVSPPIQEQYEIAAYLDEQTAKIDALIAETERFIELSWERRSALITAVVTGQIDVQGEVA